MKHAANDRDHSHSTAARERKLGTTSGGDIRHLVFSPTRATLLYIMQHGAIGSSEPLKLVNARTPSPLRLNLAYASARIRTQFLTATSLLLLGTRGFDLAELVLQPYLP